jgi:hypothetical protein
MRGTVCKRIRRLAVKVADPTVRGEAEKIYIDEKKFYTKKSMSCGTEPKLKKSRRQQRLYGKKES